MAIVLKDRVKVSSGVTGTGTATLGAAANGFQSFAVVGDASETYYTISMQPGSVDGDFEVGIGTVTDTAGTFTLSRDTVLESSNAGSLVDFPAGTKDVFVTYPAERAVFLNAAGTAVTALDIATLGATAANLTTATITSGTITTTPASGNDLVNKTYVDNLVSSGTHFHEPVRVESPVNISATYNNGTDGVGATLTNAGAQAALVIDGITLDVADRVLIYEQTDETQNGVYVVTDVGSGATNWILTRSADADTSGLVGPDTLSEGSTFFVKEGATGAGETYTCNVTSTIIFGTTNITFAQISAAQIYSAGTGLTLTGVQFSITDTGTAGTYGAAASVPVFTTNAQGQVTAVTNTAIAITSGSVSGLAASATTDTTNASNISTGTLGTSRLSGSYTGITGVGTLAAGTWNGSVIGAVYGGTGFASYTVGDLLFADTTTSLAKLADVAVGNALISGGVGSAPVYGKIGLATHVSGTLPVANGGTGVTSATGTGSVVLSSSPTLVTPALGTPASGNLANCTFPTLNQSTTGNAATATALQNARTIGGVSFNGTANINLPGVNTAGNQNTTGTAANVTGTVAIANGGTAGTTAQAARNNIAGAVTSGQYLRGNGTNVLMSAIQAADVPTLNQNTTGNAATATALQTARTIGGVSFNGTANINLPGVNTAGNQNTTGSAATLTTGRTIAMTGDVTYTSGSFNGSTNVTGTATLANSGVAASTYTLATVTVDSKGRVTSASSGSAPEAIPAGTVMLFVQTAAPTGFTKSTTHNNKALRVVSGTAGTGGSVAFTTAFASQAASGTVGATTLTIDQIPSHNHGGSTGSGGAASGSVSAGRAGDIGPFRANSGIITRVTNLPNRTQGSGGEGGTFTMNINVPNHTHSISSQGGSGSHTHGFTGSSINLAVQYVDVIIATKD